MPGATKGGGPKPLPIDIYIYTKTQPPPLPCEISLCNFASWALWHFGVCFFIVRWGFLLCVMGLLQSLLRGPLHSGLVLFFGLFVGSYFFFRHGLRGQGRGLYLWLDNVVSMSRQEINNKPPLHLKGGASGPEISRPRCAGGLDSLGQRLHAANPTARRPSFPVCGVARGMHC